MNSRSNARLETHFKEAKGRPKIRWEDYIRKDIQRLKVPNWKTFVQERGRWKEVVGKAKTRH